MHENTPDGIFMTSHKNTFALVDSLWDNSLCIKRYWPLHAVMQALCLGKLSVDLPLPRLNATIDCLRQWDREILHIFSSFVIVSRIVERIWRYFWRSNLEPTAPFLQYEAVRWSLVVGTQWCVIQGLQFNSNSPLAGLLRIRWQSFVCFFLSMLHTCANVRMCVCEKSMLIQDEWRVMHML